MFSGPWFSAASRPWFIQADSELSADSKTWLCCGFLYSGILIWLLHVSFKIAYLGIAICNLKSTHKDHPPQAAQTFNYSRPQIVLNTFWLVLLVVSFTSPLGFLSFHCPFNFLSFHVPFLSFPFLSLSFPFLSFHCPFNFLSFPFIVLSFPFLSYSNQDFLGFFLEITLFGAHTWSRGGFINKRPTLGNHMQWLAILLLKRGPVGT